METHYEQFKVPSSPVLTELRAFESKKKCFIIIFDQKTRDPWKGRFQNEGNRKKIAGRPSPANFQHYVYNFRRKSARCLPHYSPNILPRKIFHPVDRNHVSPLMRSEDTRDSSWSKPSVAAVRFRRCAV